MLKTLYIDIIMPENAFYDAYADVFSMLYFFHSFQFPTSELHHDEVMLCAPAHLLYFGALGVTLEGNDNFSFTTEDTEGTEV
nr:hypothetical protein [uncultured Bacteroides sp.]